MFQACTPRIPPAWHPVGFMPIHLNHMGRVEGPLDCQDPPPRDWPHSGLSAMI